MVLSNTAMIVNTRMSAEDALACVREINSHAAEIRKLLLKLYREEGYVALGFRSFREFCMSDYLHYATSTLYHMLAQGIVEEHIQLSTGSADSISDNHLRAIGKFDPAYQPTVYQLGKAVAARSNIELTATVFEEAGKALMGSFITGTFDGVMPIDAAVTEEVYERVMEQSASLRPRVYIKQGERQLADGSGEVRVIVPDEYKRKYVRVTMWLDDGEE